jgi:hypothetical protein
MEAKALFVGIQATPQQRQCPILIVPAQEPTKGNTEVTLMLKPHAYTLQMLWFCVEVERYYGARDALLSRLCLAIA